MYNKTQRENSKKLKSQKKKNMTLSPAPIAEVENEMYQLYLVHLYSATTKSHLMIRLRHNIPQCILNIVR